MKCTWKAWVCLLAIGGALCLASTAEAKRGPLYEHSPFTKVSHKFMRGVGNLTLGWVEVPVGINEEVQNLDPLTGFFTGLVKGTWRGIQRTVVGAGELLTFPVPLPGVGYDPLLAPDVVMQQDISRPDFNKQFSRAPLWKRIGNACKSSLRLIGLGGKKADDGMSSALDKQSPGRRFGR